MEWNFGFLEAGLEIVIAVSRDLAKSDQLASSVAQCSFCPSGSLTFSSCRYWMIFLKGSCEPDLSGAMHDQVDRQMPALCGRWTDILSFRFQFLDMTATLKQTMSN